MTEKYIEKKFNEAVKKAGGWSLKFLPYFVAGLPDRIALFPGGKIFFAELKAPGKEPSIVQLLVHKKLIKLGFRVEVIDNLEQINLLIKDYAD